MLKVEYDVQVKARPRYFRYKAEREAINNFIASEHENICFTYNEQNKAKNACQSIMWFAKSYRKPIRAMQRGNQMIVVKTK